jgi:hypothetical protein
MSRPLTEVFIAIDGRRQKRGLAAGALAALGVLASGCSAVIPSAPGAVLFQDDFSRSSTGWDTFEEPGYRADYVDGALRVRVEAENSLAWSTPNFELGDVRLEVDTTALSGPADNAFGLVCRFRDPGNFTFLLISSDGYSGIGVVQDGQRSLLTGSAMLPSDDILQGLTSNHLRAECVGPRLSLYINGALANEAAVADWEAGDVGVIVGTYATPGVEIQFDNFSIANP